MTMILLIKKNVCMKCHLNVIINATESPEANIPITVVSQEGRSEPTESNLKAFGEGLLDHNLARNPGNPHATRGSKRERTLKSSGNNDYALGTFLVPNYINVLEGYPLLYECKVCKKKFKSKQTIRHHKFCQNGKSKPFQCKPCDRGFITRAHYEYHLNTHKATKPQYHCEVCKKQFNTKAHMKYHQFCRKGAPKKPFHCDKCDQGFIIKSHYEYHIRTKHSGGQSFSCAKCGEVFNQKDKLTKHKRSHKIEKSSSSQKSKPNGRAFVNVKVINSDSGAPGADLSFVCGYCNNSFADIENLENHFMTHVGNC